MSTNAKASNKGKRYTDAEKKEILDHVAQVNAEKGRGGQSAASKKYGISQLTISGWLKAGGVSAPKSGKKPGRKPGRKAKAESSAPAAATAAPAKAPKASSTKSVVNSDINTKLSEMLSIGTQIEKYEKELSSLREKFNAIKSSL